MFRSPGPAVNRPRWEEHDVDPSIERIAGDVMAVNSFVVHGPDGVVVVDGMLTNADGRKVRRAVEAAGRPLAGVIVTHPHPDHYAAAAHVVGPDDVPIVATTSVDAVIRRDDALKDTIVGPLMGDEWPTDRPFPTLVVPDDGEVELGGLAWRARSLGPGESDADTLWQAGGGAVFAGDVAYNGMHAYLADGRWAEWLALLDGLAADLPAATTLHVGHGPSGGLDLLTGQRAYVETFVDAVRRHGDAVAAGDHGPVLAALRALVPGEDLLFLADLSIDPLHEALAGSGAS